MRRCSECVYRPTCPAATQGRKIPRAGAVCKTGRTYFSPPAKSHARSSLTLARDGVVHKFSAADPPVYARFAKMKCTRREMDDR